jgi:argininosuccinate lyase
VAFREAHATVGKVVSMAEDQKKEMSDLTLEELQTVRFRIIVINMATNVLRSIILLRNYSSAFDSSVASIWNYEHSVEQYQVAGGTSRRAVQKQIDDLKALLELRKVPITASSTAL